jgi:hypothetical protein
VTGRPVRTVYHSDLKALFRASRDDNKLAHSTIWDVLHDSGGILEIEDAGEREWERSLVISNLVLN